MENMWYLPGMTNLYTARRSTQTLNALILLTRSEREASVGSMQK